MQSLFNALEVHEINALSHKNESFSSIGTQFCKACGSKDPGMLSLTLVAMYQEHGSIIHVTQRLVLVYLIYRLKDLGAFGENKATESVNPSSLLHPFLIVLVRIYAGFASTTVAGGQPDLLRLISGFPDVTPQEGHFVGRLLTDGEAQLTQLFEMTPSEVADNPVYDHHQFDVQQHIEVAQSQLAPYSLFGKEGVQDNECDTKGSLFLPDSDPALYDYHARLVYSLCAAPFVRIEPSIMPPCDDEFNFIYTSLIEPEQVRDDWLKDEEWGQEKMRTLQTAMDEVKLSSRSSAPSSPSQARKNTDRSPPNAWPLAHANLRNFALDALRKIAAGSGTLLAKADSVRIVSLLSDDASLFREANISVEDFSKFVETQPDIAAELLLYELATGDDALALHLEMILSFDLSVQSIVTSLLMPSEFLNRFITLCMDSCEQQNRHQLLVNRLVRMVCVFFSAIIRLKSFDIKPRLTEMQNFCAMFSSVKEASALYQSIMQAK